MDWGHLESRWGQMTAQICVYWGRLKEGEVKVSRGNRERFTNLLRSRYDIPREEAERQIKTFLEQYTFYEKQY
ncbi:MAG: CsbD family protein [Pseudomonadota bacterium]